MNIALTGNKITLVNTNSNCLDKIVYFEQQNKLYVGEYSRQKHEELLSGNNCLHLSIHEKHSNELVGHVILFGLDSHNKSLEFRRIVINKKDRGYGRDAIRSIKKICFEMLGFHRLWLDVFDDNPRAISLYESEGFVLEAILRENIIANGNTFRSQRIYSMLEHEYRDN